MAQYEKSIGVKSTYFLMITSDFYNVFSDFGQNSISDIISCGCEIGLHFDEEADTACTIRNDIEERIEKEIKILSEAVGRPVKAVSMHRPSEDTLNRAIHIPGVINTYSELYFREFKYFSDSRMHWREPVLEMIESGKYDRLQILIHPFWYGDNETTIGSIISRWVNSANYMRYRELDNNFTGLDSVMKEDGIVGEEIRAI